MDNADEQEQIESYFTQDAHEKRGFYLSKNIAEIQSELQKRPMWKIYAKTLDTITKDITNTCSVCDLGCGMGHFLIEITSRPCFTEIFGVDYIQDTFGIARQNPHLFGDVRFIQADMKTLPFHDNTFDMVFCLNVLHHFQEKQFYTIVSECMRVSRRFIIIEIRNKAFLLNNIYSLIILPLSYRNLPLYSTSIPSISQFMEKKGFHLVSVHAKKRYIPLNRRILLTYEKNI